MRTFFFDKTHFRNAVFVIFNTQSLRNKIRRAIKLEKCNNLTLSSICVTTHLHSIHFNTIRLIYNTQNIANQWYQLLTAFIGIVAWLFGVHRYIAHSLNKSTLDYQI